MNNPMLNARSKLTAVHGFKTQNPAVSPFVNSQNIASTSQGFGIKVLSPSSGHKVMPTVLDALVLREEVRKGGVYGIGKLHSFDLFVFCMLRNFEHAFE